MTDDLYNELGVVKDATPDEIKKAGKRRAKATHPDAGGDKTAFERSRLAVAVLSNPERRKRYDETGKTDQESPENEATQAVQLACMVFNQILELIQQDESDHVNNVIKLTIERIADMKREHQATIKKLEKSVRGTERALKRLKRKKPGTNVLGNVLTEKLKTSRERLDSAKDFLSRLSAARVVLDDYDWEVDPPPPKPTGSEPTFFTINISTAAS